MKKYEKPEVKEIKVILQDCIAVSGGGDYNDGGNWGTPHK